MVNTKMKQPIFVAKAGCMTSTGRQWAMPTNWCSRGPQKAKLVSRA